MKINIQSDYSPYRKKLGENIAAKAALGFSEAASKVDTNAISKGATKIPDKQMLAMKSGVHSHISAPADTQRLLKLRESIQSGSYRIDSDEIAKSILGNF